MVCFLLSFLWLVAEFYQWHAPSPRCTTRTLLVLLDSLKFASTQNIFVFIKFVIELYDSASSLNPFSWVREKLSPGAREKESQEELVAAKREAKAQGQLSIFDTAPQKQAEDKAIAARDTIKSAKASKAKSVSKEVKTKTKKHKVCNA